MLVLTRKEGEGIIIGTDGIEVTILEVRGTQIRVGISAPREVTILRKELYVEVANANQQAVLTKPAMLKEVMSGIEKQAVSLQANESEGKSL